jgi:hypothetical protein
MPVKPWYKIVTPREDLREGKPPDASKFAVHLDQVREGRAPADYQKPERFFERTYLTKNLTSLASEVIRLLGTRRHPLRRAGPGDLPEPGRPGLRRKGAVLLLQPRRRWKEMKENP